MNCEDRACGVYWKSFTCKRAIENVSKRMSLKAIEKLGRLELPFTKLGNVEGRKGWGSVTMDI